MEDARERVKRWVEDTPSILGMMRQFLDEHEQAQAVLEAAERGCRRLRQELETVRTENDRLREERSEIADMVAEGLGKANEALLRFRAPMVAPATVSVAAPEPAPVATVATPATSTAAAAVAPAPAADSAPAAPPVATPTPEEPMEPGPRRILLVDDDEDFRSMITEYLAGSRGYEVRQAVSGKEALTLLPGFQPHVVLLDLMMPGGGMDTLQQIKTLYPGLCVVIVSAHEDSIIVRRALALGADDYVTKPFDVDYLDAVLNGFMTKDAPDGGEAPAFAAPQPGVAVGPAARPIKSPFARR